MRPSPPRAAGPGCGGQGLCLRSRGVCGAARGRRRPSRRRRRSGPRPRRPRRAGPPRGTATRLRRRRSRPRLGGSAAGGRPGARVPRGAGPGRRVPTRLRQRGPARGRPEPEYEARAPQRPDAPAGRPERPSARAEEEARTQGAAREEGCGEGSVRATAGGRDARAGVSDGSSSEGAAGGRTEAGAGAVGAWPEARDPRGRAPWTGRGPGRGRGRGPCPPEAGALRSLRFSGKPKGSPRSPPRSLDHGPRRGLTLAHPTPPPLTTTPETHWLPLAQWWVRGLPHQNPSSLHLRPNPLRVPKSESRKAAVVVAGLRDELLWSSALYSALGDLRIASVSKQKVNSKLLERRVGLGVEALRDPFSMSGVPLGVVRQKGSDPTLPTNFSHPQTPKAFS